MILLLISMKEPRARRPMLESRSPRTCPGATQGLLRRYPGATQELPRSYPGATQELPRSYPGATQEPPRSYPGATRGLRNAPEMAGNSWNCQNLQI